MKICFISNLYSPFVIGGAEIYVERIAKALSENHEVAIITSVPYKNRNSLGYSFEVRGRVKVYSFYSLNIYHAYYTKRKPLFLKPLWHGLDLWNPHSYLVIRQILNLIQPDIVHTHNLNGFSLSVIDAVGRARFPLMHTCHDFSLLCPYATFKCPLREDASCSRPLFVCNVYRQLKKAVIANKPAVVVFPSKSTQSEYVKNNFFPLSRQEVLHYCIGSVTMNTRERKEEEPFNILYVGQLTEHKGVQVLINAFKGLSYGNANLHIVGSGDYGLTLKRMAGNDERIFFYGKVENADVTKFYAMADVTVVPSIWPEVFGIVILESFSHGVPVIGSNIGGIPEVIKEGYNGFMREPGDFQGLKDSLEKIIDNFFLLRSMRINALESSRLFDINKHVGELTKIYKSLIH